MKEVYRSILDIITLLLNEEDSEYMIKEFTSKDCGKGLLVGSNRSWSSLDGKLVVLGKKEVLSKIDNDINNLGKVLYELTKSYTNGETLLLASDFYYEESGKLFIRETTIIPSDFNCINCYLHDDKLKEKVMLVRNYVINNGFDILNNEKLVTFEVRAIEKKKALKKCLYK